VSERAGARVRPTARSLGLAAAGLALLAAGILLGRPEIVAIGAVLVLFPLAALGLALLAPRLARAPGPEAARLLGTPARAWEPLHVHVLIDSGPAPAGREATPGFLAESIDHPGGELRYEVVPRLRGRHVLGPLVRVDEDALGLSRSRVPLGAATEVLVAPGTPSEAPSEHALALLGRARGRGDTTPDTLTRPYRDGDPVRRIHWAVSARQGKLMVRPDAEDHEASSVVLVDRAAGHYPGADAHVQDRQEEIRVPAGFEAALASTAQLLHQDHQGPAPRLAFFPPLPQEQATHPLALALPSGGSAAPPAAAAGGVIVTGIPGAAAATWPAAWPARHVHVLLHGDPGRTPPAAVLAAWAAAGWTHTLCPGVPPGVHSGRPREGGHA
jgi:hypothetical protein